MPSPAAPSPWRVHRGPAPRGPKAKGTCWCPPCPRGSSEGKKVTESKGRSHSLECLRSRQENLSCIGSCTSCRCKLRDASALRSKLGAGRGGGGVQERCSRGKRGDQRDALKAGAVVLKQAANLHAFAALMQRPKLPKIYYCWPFSGSCMRCVFLAEKALQQMPVYGCGIVFGLIIEPWSWENRRKPPGTFPPFPSKSFVTPSCIFSSPARSGVGGTAGGVVTPVGSLISSQHIGVKQSFTFYISKDFHCHKTPPNKLAGSSTMELAIEYHKPVPDFL